MRHCRTEYLKGSNHSRIQSRRPSVPSLHFAVSARWWRGGMVEAGEGGRLPASVSPSSCSRVGAAFRPFVREKPNPFLGFQGLFGLVSSISTSIYHAAPHLTCAKLSAGPGPFRHWPGEASAGRGYFRQFGEDSEPTRSSSGMLVLSLGVGVCLIGCSGPNPRRPSKSSITMKWAGGLLSAR